MKTFPVLSACTIALLVISCTQRTEPDRASSDGAMENDSAWIETSHSPRTNDTTNYIGFIHRFDDNATFYTDLYFKPDFNYDTYDAVKRLCNEVVYEGADLRRHKLPIATAEKYFNLSGLDTITVYDSHSSRLTTGVLTHVELIEDMIEDSFVAVFELDDPAIDDFVYCIGNASSELTLTDVNEKKDPVLDSMVIQAITRSINRPGDVKHYQQGPQVMYSVVSADTTAIIVRSDIGGRKVVYASKHAEAVFGLTIVPLNIHGEPLLLIEAGMPETDMLWSSLLVFDGAQYQVAMYQRTKL